MLVKWMFSYVSVFTQLALLVKSKMSIILLVLKKLIDSVGVPFFAPHKYGIFFHRMKLAWPKLRITDEEEKELSFSQLEFPEELPAEEGRHAGRAVAGPRHALIRGRQLVEGAPVLAVERAQINVVLAKRDQRHCLQSNE